MQNKKVALITGYCRGIGKATAKDLSQNGYEVMGVHKGGHKEGRNEEISKTFTVDLSNKSEILEFLSEMQNTEIDVSVNNAGIFQQEVFDNYDLAIWEETMNVNLNAPFYLGMGLKDNIRKDGSIINIASTDGFTGSFGSMAYSASKAALINLTKSLANNFGPKGIRVNAVAPGWINTGMSTEESFEAATLTPLGRNGRLEEVAKLVSFLASEKASFINGATITIDGGYSNVDYIMKKEST